MHRNGRLLGRGQARHVADRPEMDLEHAQAGRHLQVAEVVVDDAVVAAVAPEQHQLGEAAPGHRLRDVHHHRAQRVAAVGDRAGPLLVLDALAVDRRRQPEHDRVVRRRASAAPRISGPTSESVMTGQVRAVLLDGADAQDGSGVRVALAHLTDLRPGVVAPEAIRGNRPVDLHRERVRDLLQHENDAPPGWNRPRRRRRCREGYPLGWPWPGCPEIMTTNAPLRAFGGANR